MIREEILRGLVSADYTVIAAYFDDTDTYIRKAAYTVTGRVYKSKLAPQRDIIRMLGLLIKSESERIRQTVVNAAGETAMNDFTGVEFLYEYALCDLHHSVRNAVQGSLKKAGEVNPAQIIPFCRKHILSPEPEIRRTVAHGLELRGRTHPEDIMPVLRLLQFEKHKRVRPMLVHIFGQISYKKDCLKKVTAELLTWEDEKLADECFEEIIKQHHHINNHFRTVETLSPRECEEYLSEARKRHIFFQHTAFSNDNR